MAPACCCSFGHKLSNARTSPWRKSPTCSISPMYEAVIMILLMLVLGANRATGVLRSVQNEAFNSFHLRPPVRGQQQHHYSQSRWKDLRTSGSEGFLPWSMLTNDFAQGGGVALPLVHRDTKDSPFRVDLNSQFNVKRDDYKEADFATIFRNSIQRDVARVEAISSLITKGMADRRIHSRKVHGETPPIESPIFPGLGLGSGEYFTTLSIGTPPAAVLLTMDTGSDLFWIQCKPCDSCYDQINAIFDSSQSGSYQPVLCDSRACASLRDSRCDENQNCEYDETYGDNSFSTGEFASETVTMNSTTRDRPVEIDRLLFGCGHDNEGLFTASAGILGLGRGPFSFPSQTSNVLTPRFSYCLTDRFPSSETDGDDDGGSKPTATTATSYLLFGEVAATQSMQYTALLKNSMAPSFYYLQLTGLSVGNKLLKIPASALELDVSSGRGGAILDSGTAVTRLSTGAYEAVRDAFREEASHLTRVELPNQDFFDSCYQLADGESVPSVTLHFAGSVDLALPIDNTIIPVDDSGSLYCLAFARSDARGDLTIIGNIQQQGFRIEFDLAKNQVGFTPQDCSQS